MPEAITVGELRQAVATLTKQLEVLKEDQLAGRLTHLRWSEYWRRLDAVQTVIDILTVGEGEDKWC